MHRSVLKVLTTSRPGVPVLSRASARLYSSTKDIAEGQHTGSRKAPEPTKKTGTSTQAPHDAPASELKTAHQQMPASQTQDLPSEETGTKNYMASNEDTQNGEIKSGTPFRPAPVEKKVG